MGAGTTFTIAFPLRQLDLPASPRVEKPPSASEELPRIARKAPSAASILLVDS